MYIWVFSISVMTYYLQIQKQSKFWEYANDTIEYGIIYQKCGDCKLVDYCYDDYR